MLACFQSASGTIIPGRFTARLPPAVSSVRKAHRFTRLKLTHCLLFHPFFVQPSISTVRGVVAPPLPKLVGFTTMELKSQQGDNSFPIIEMEDN